MLEWRLKAYRHWVSLEKAQAEPKWANVKYPPIDYQDIVYYSAPKQKPESEESGRGRSRDSAHLRKAGHSAGGAEAAGRRGGGRGVRQRLGGDHLQGKAGGGGRHLLFVFRSGAEASRTGAEISGLGGAAHRQLFRRAERRGVHRRLVCYVPKGVRCPMELSTYFRINAAETGQFERTLIVADEGAYVSYLEGCTAPMRDENQLHAAVVELVALDNAQIKYSTVQNWYPGDKNGKGGIYNSSPSAASAPGANSKISWTQVETGSAITWKYPELHPAGRQFGRRVLLRGADQQLPAGRHRHQDDPPRQEHPQHDRLQGHFRRPRAEHLSRAW